MGNVKPLIALIASIYRKHAGTISIFLGLLSLLIFLVSFIKGWPGPALFALVLGSISLWISKDLRKRIAKSIENGQSPDIPEDQKRLITAGAFLRNSYFSPILIVVLLIALGCVMIIIFFLPDLYK